ncbi:hypothetical protein, partial [Dokdonella sp.]
MKRSIAAILLVVCLPLAGAAWASGEKAERIERDYVTAPNAPAFQTWDQADEKSRGCISCHTESDRKTMHASSAVVLGCTDCH